MPLISVIPIIINGKLSTRGQMQMQIKTFKNLHQNTQHVNTCKNRPGCGFHTNITNIESNRKNLTHAVLKCNYQYLSNKRQPFICVQDKGRILTDPLLITSSLARPHHLLGHDFSHWIRYSFLTEQVPLSKLSQTLFLVYVQCSSSFIVIQYLEDLGGRGRVINVEMWGFVCLRYIIP